jgi:hypothetical protein
MVRGHVAHVLRRLADRLDGPALTDDGVDLDDQESEDATERELAWMWLNDLEGRVAELEALLQVDAGAMGIDERVAELEALAEFLPELHAMRERACVQDQHRPLW